jgi:hypothetical protein
MDKILFVHFVFAVPLRKSASALNYMLSQFRRVDEGQKASFQSATMTRSNAVQNIAQGFHDVYHKLWGTLALVQYMGDCRVSVEILWNTCGNPVENHRLPVGNLKLGRVGVLPLLVELPQLG